MVLDRANGIVDKWCSRGGSSTSTSVSTSTRTSTSTSTSTSTRPSTSMSTIPRTPFILSPDKRSFRGPGGVGRGLNSLSRDKICARELASVASRCLLGLPVGSHGLPLTTGRTIYIIPKFQVRHWDQVSNVPVYRPQIKNSHK